MVDAINESINHHSYMKWMAKILHTIHRKNLFIILITILRKNNWDNFVLELDLRHVIVLL